MSGPASGPEGGQALPPELEQLARVPLLPIEAPLVQAVRALEAMKVQVDLLLFLLEQMPGGSVQIAAAVDTFTGQANAAIGAITRFREIRECRGQA